MMGVNELVQNWRAFKVEEQRTCEKRGGSGMKSWRAGNVVT